MDAALYRCRVWLLAGARRKAPAMPRAVCFPYRTCSHASSLAEAAGTLGVGNSSCFVAKDPKSFKRGGAFLVLLFQPVAAREFGDAPYFPQAVVLAVVVDLVDVDMRAHGAISPITSA